jgi:hypothetical protein
VLLVLILMVVVDNSVVLVLVGSSETRITRILDNGTRCWFERSFQTFAKLLNSD